MAGTQVGGGTRMGSTRGGTSVVGGGAESELGAGTAGGSSQPSDRGGGSRAGTTSGRTTAMSAVRSVTSVGSTHMVEVRNVQKRLGFLVSATDLANDMKEELRATVTSIAMQVREIIIENHKSYYSPPVPTL